MFVMGARWAVDIGDVPAGAQTLTIPPEAATQLNHDENLDAVASARGAPPAGPNAISWPGWGSSHLQKSFGVAAGYVVSESSVDCVAKHAYARSAEPSKNLL